MATMQSTKSALMILLRMSSSPPLWEERAPVPAPCPCGRPGSGARTCAETGKVDVACRGVPYCQCTLPNSLSCPSVSQVEGWGCHDEVVLQLGAAAIRQGGVKLARGGLNTKGGQIHLDRLLYKNKIKLWVQYIISSSYGQL